MGTIYHVTILGSTNKTEISRIGNWISVMSRGKGQAPLRFRDTLANVSGLRTLGNPWIFRVGPLLRLRISIPEHTFPGPYRPKIEAPHPTTT